VCICALSDLVGIEFASGFELSLLPLCRPLRKVQCGELGTDASDDARPHAPNHRAPPPAESNQKAILLSESRPIAERGQVSSGALGRPVHITWRSGMSHGPARAAGSMDVVLTGTSRGLIDVAHQTEPVHARPTIRIDRCRAWPRS